jgi:hypothetical protein
MGTEIVKQENPQSFIERLIEHAEDLEKIKEVGMVIINSGFCPEHFKQSKDAVGAIMCIEAGRKLGLTWMQSLSDIYPVKGRIGIMGSAARAVIFSSGVLDKWEEITEGTYPEDTYKHIIISKRKGLPGEFRSEFSVYDAKRAGLFGKDIYQRYGKRLIMWRNIGFHSTDYYGDIMKGMKTVEELNDFDIIPGVGDTTIEKEDGTKITVQGGSKQRATKMTDRVVDKIPDNKFGKVNENIQEAEIVKEDPKNVPPEYIERNRTPVEERETVLIEKKEESPFIAEKGSVEFFEGKEVSRNDVPGKEGDLTLAVMEKMETADLLKIINDDMDMREALQIIPGKNTNKKAREIIDAHQRGKLGEHVAPHLSAETGQKQDIAPAQTQQGEIPLNTAFDQQSTKQGTPTKNADFLQPDAPKAKAGNKYNIEVPELGAEGKRDFAVVKTLFNALLNITPQINQSRYAELATKKGVVAVWPDKEGFLKSATTQMVNEILDIN